MQTSSTNAPHRPIYQSHASRPEFDVYGRFEIETGSRTSVGSASASAELALPANLRQGLLHSAQPTFANEPLGRTS